MLLLLLLLRSTVEANLLLLLLPPRRLSRKDWAEQRQVGRHAGRSLRNARQFAVDGGDEEQQVRPRLIGQWGGEGDEEGKGVRDGGGPSSLRPDGRGAAVFLQSAPSFISAGAIVNDSYGVFSPSAQRSVAVSSPAKRVTATAAVVQMVGGSPTTGLSARRTNRRRSGKGARGD